MNENSTALEKYAFYKGVVKAIEYFTKELEYANRQVESYKNRLDEDSENTYYLSCLRDYELESKVNESMIEYLKNL